MEMHQVRYFLAVSRTLNFTRAADDCHVSQPSLTKAIQKLEEELGGLLLRRERGLTHLTDMGRLMLPHFEQTYAAAQAAKSLAEVLRRADLAPLKLGITDTIFLDGLPEMLAELNRALKGLQLLVTHASHERTVDEAMRGELDLVLVNAVEDMPERLRLRPLFSETFLVLAQDGGPFHNRPEIALGELAGSPWIERLDCPVAAGFMAFCAAQDIGLAVRHRARSDFAVQQMVKAGMGLGLACRSTPRLPGIEVVALSQLDLKRTVALGTIAGRQFSHAADAFVRLVRMRNWEGTPPAPPMVSESA